MRLLLALFLAPACARTSGPFDDTGPDTPAFDPWFDDTETAFQPSGLTCTDVETRITSLGDAEIPLVFRVEPPRTPYLVWDLEVWGSYVAGCDPELGSIALGVADGGAPVAESFVPALASQVDDYGYWGWPTRQFVWDEPVRLDDGEQLDVVFFPEYAAGMSSCWATCPNWPAGAGPWSADGRDEPFIWSIAAEEATPYMTVYGEPEAP